MITTQTLALSTGIKMQVGLAGPADAPPAILLHGFPETHRTWARVAERLDGEVRLVMPDLRGFGGSDRPTDVAAYKTDLVIADILALAEALGIEDFALVGHDWGGAVAWAMALRGLPEVTRLAIVNSPHPALFQRSILADDAQRAASQYMRAFRDPAMETKVAAMGFDSFFDKSFAKHVDLASIDPAERAASIAEWSRPGALTAMFNWYRASLIAVPEMGEAAPIPNWVTRGLPRLKIPVRVIWGLDDKALLPIQLEGLGEVGDDVEVLPLPGVGHFATWQAPDAVADALRPFLTPLPQRAIGG